MKKIPLADAEWRVMRLLWERSPLSCRQIEDQLKNETGWTRHTLFSFLKRMVERGVIRTDNTVHPKLYFPILDQKKAVREETRAFADKLFGGDLRLLVSNIVAHEELDDSELNAMFEDLKKAKEARGK
ncbi:MAG: BlaI/MecI/CopY family transcriptional regulator [Clostridiales bacterium]|jgi:BlaI family penicillinase repressor|nr:BlaI/MecI/CopY family transcriptional regulator [Clostridiales bacterium]